MPDKRPTPEELLARVQQEHRRAGAGRLKVFFGAAPGVGKTYAMLASALRLAREGVDVVVGIVETHGRTETEQQLLGLEMLPQRTVEYRGVSLREFDLDGALRRRPEVLLVDELAHTNAPGSRHAKRWEDIQELLKAGIHVFTTLNVQHLESLNDVVAQITGVQVRETVPDAVVEEADEIELVDLPADVLLERLKAGKVYVPEAAQAAIASFFRKGNLTALRELALRRTAEWVDAEMRSYKEGRGIRSVWPAGDRILVCVSPSPTSSSLVRAAKRMAAGLSADVIAVYVETASSVGMAAADRDRVMQTLRIAESLGAETVTLTTPPGSDDAAGELIAFARSRNVSKIVIGKTGRSRLSEALRGSFMSDVIRRSGEIEVAVIQDDEERPRREALDTPVSDRGTLGWWTRRCIGATAIVALSTLAAWWRFEPPDLSEEAMIFLAGIVVVAWRFGRTATMIATVLSVLSFNFFFTEPRFTLMVNNRSYLVTFAVMLAAGLLVGTLTARTRDQAERARSRERRTASLYAMTRALATARDRAEVMNAAVQHIHDTFEADAALLLPAGTALEIAASAGDPDWLDDHELSVGRSAFDHGRVTGLGTQTLAAAHGRYLPLSVVTGRVAVLAVRPRHHSTLLTPPQLLLLDTFANQVALALERVSLIESRQAARFDAESERLRSALLSSVSHDLRTPLASIAGAASTLLETEASLDGATRRDLIRSIDEEAKRLNTLIANLVFATRLEAGVELRREWTSIEEIVGAGLATLRSEIGDRAIQTRIPTGLPLVRVDSAMLAQVVHNLAENAVRYTDASVPIVVTAWATDNAVVTSVTDEGPGLAQGELAKVFDRFYRGRAARVGGKAIPGMGLGLDICQGIVKAHGGRIWVEPNVPQGVSFRFSLPIETPQPAAPIEAEVAT